jgi:2,4-dienoyl-CoA reductase-like NADH-dependent reductase (Old Yellow Enzyme family)
MHISFIIVEATAVLPEERITPEDAGFWKDSQTPGLRRINDYIHVQGQKAGIQLQHSGRKLSCLARGKEWSSRRGK